MNLEELITLADKLRQTDPEGAELPGVVNAINAIRAEEDTSGLQAWIERVSKAPEAARVPIVQQVQGARRGRPPRSY